MTRIIVAIVSILFSMKHDAQIISYDDKVEELFFNVDVAKPSLDLVKKFRKVRDLVYERPTTSTISLNGKFLTHSFKFKEHAYLINSFDAGIIKLDVVKYGPKKRLHNIFWSLTFDKKEDALRVFDELKSRFRETNVIQKVYSSNLALETAEFTNKESKKYPYIMFMLFDKKGLDKMYRIFFSLDNDTHYEN